MSNDTPAVTRLAAVRTRKTAHTYHSTADIEDAKWRLHATLRYILDGVELPEAVLERARDDMALVGEVPHPRARA